MKNYTFMKKLQHIFLTLTLLATLGVGQIWGVYNYNWYGKVLFQVPTAWDLTTNGTVQVGCARTTSTTTSTYQYYFGTMTNVANTRLYYANISANHSSWNQNEYLYFTANSSTYGSGEFTVKTNTYYTTPLDYGVANNSGGYLFTPSSNTNGTAVSGSYQSNSTSWNYTQTIKYAVSNNGGTPAELTSGTVPATIAMSSYKFASGTFNSVSASSANKTLTAGGSNYSATISAARTATTTLTVSNVTSGYTFLGWYSAANGGTQLSTNTTYTYYPTAATAVFARFSHETTHSVVHTEYCTSTSTQLSTETVPVGEVTYSTFTAPAKTGYNFVNWTVGNGLTVKSGDSNTSNPIHVITKSSGTYTLQANYTEDLTTNWYIAGDAPGTTAGSPFAGWGTSGTRMSKKTGHSTEEIYYCTLNVTTVASADNHFQFKVYNHGNAHYYSSNDAGNYWVTKDNNSVTVYDNTGNNMKFRPYITGTYEFKVDNTGSNPVLTVTWPDYNQLRFYSAQSGGTGTNTYDFENTGTSTWTKSVSLTAGTTYWFKVIEHSEFFSNSGTMTRANHSNWTMDGTSNNCGITADVTGTYTFSYTPSTNSLSVTYPAAYTVTYNANGATGGNVPEGSGTTYYASGSNVTLATNTGILYKTGNAFNGWNTLSGGGGTHYASGGTLTGISGNVTLYAEWKANDNHMYFYNKDNWPAVAAYMWSAVNDPEQSYPGRTMSPHQGKVYKIDYRSDVQQNVVFNNNYTGSGTEYKTGDLTIADGNSGDHWFYNDEVKTVNTGGIHHGWSQYIMVAGFPTSTVAAVVGERITLSPVLAWAEDVTFNDIEITSTRTSGDASVNAIISGTNIIVSGTTANTSATFTITYRYSTTTITKTLTVNIKNGIVIQSKVPQDDNHWVYSNVMKLHYWGTGISDGDVTMAWVKADNDYTYFQTFVPLGTDNKINFLFYYDYMNMSEMWRQTTDITNVTTAGCYEIKHNNGLAAQRTWSRSEDNCVDTWQVEITMGSGDIFTSNVVENSTDIISFFAPSNANESHTYRQGVVTLEHNGATVATIPAATFTQSGVYTAKVNTSTPGLTNVALYTGNYYIRTDASSGGWDNYKTDPLNKMTNFNRNTNFPNETFSYYWVDNVAKTPGDPVNIKATVANDYNPVLTNFSIDESVAREEHGINLRFGYEPTTNELVRGILRGSNENNFLNVIGTTGNIYRDATCTTLMDESQYSSDPSYLKMQDKSNWVYEITAYATIDNTHRGANVYLKSYYGGVHYLLGMVKDADGRDTDVPISLSVIVPGTTIDITYTLRVIYDFKTNRLFAAWAPANISVSSNMNVDADVMFLRHEQGDVAQISFANTSAEITHLNKAIFAVEIADDRSTSLGNRELHYFFSLPFDCYVKDIFGIGGFMKYWGIQYYDGAERARIGWFVETPTFWKWLGENDLLEAGKGYLLSIDKYALQDDDQWKSVNAMELEGGVWVDKGVKSILTLYFPSAGSGFSMGSATATGATKVITYPNEPCSIKRDDRDQKDSNWKCIGTPGYKNMTITNAGYTPSSENPPYWGDNTPPNFIYEFHEQTESIPYAKGTYTVTSGNGFTYHAFHSYMVQYAGTINWGDYTAGNGPSHIVARRAPQNEMSQATNVEIDLLSEDSTSLDRTFVWLREDATAGYDQNYDLNKMVESYANQIYSLSDHDIPFAANVMPYETDTVRLVVNIVNPGEFTFSMLKDEHFGLTPILYDMYKSERIDLTSADYTVELDYGKYTDRFFLLFSPVKPVATAIETTEDGTQNVLSGEAIYDVLGRRVSTVTPGHLYIVNGEKRIAQ